MYVVYLIEKKNDGVLINTQFTFDKYLSWYILLEGLNMKETTHFI